MSTTEFDFQRRLFSVGEAADYLRVSRTMVFKLLRQGSLPQRRSAPARLSAAALSTASWPDSGVSHARRGEGPPWSGAGKWTRYERRAVLTWLANLPRETNCCRRSVLVFAR